MGSYHLSIPKTFKFGNGQLISFYILLDIWLFTHAVLNTPLPQAIIWTIAEMLLFLTSGTNFSEIVREMHTFSLKIMHFKMTSSKWLQICFGFNVCWRWHDDVIKGFNSCDQISWDLHLVEAFQSLRVALLIQKSRLHDLDDFTDSWCTVT